MNRTELQSLAEDRIRDAEVLFAAGRWPAAYYLAGYAVECGLKACVMEYVERTGVILIDRKYVDKCWTHEIAKLVQAAGLETTRSRENSRNIELAANWKLVEDWNELARYQQKTEAEARQLLEAIVHPLNGVLPWIRIRW